MQWTFPSEESLKKINNDKKRKKVHDSNPFVATNTNDNFFWCDRKCGIIQINFDHITSVASIAVMFTRMVGGEGNCCINVMRLIGHNMLAETLISVDLVVETLFLYEGVRLTVEGTEGDNIIASNMDDAIIVLNKNIISDII